MEPLRSTVLARFATLLFIHCYLFRYFLNCCTIFEWYCISFSLFNSELHLESGGPKSKKWKNVCTSSNSLSVHQTEIIIIPIHFGLSCLLCCFHSALTSLHSAHYRRTQFGEESYVCFLSLCSCFHGLPDIKLTKLIL